MLSALLNEAVVAAAYKHHDCKHLFAALHNSPPNAQVRGAALCLPKPAKQHTLSTPRPSRDQSVLS